MKTTLKIFLHTLPVLLMIGLIPLVLNDYLLTAIFFFISAAGLLIAGKHDFLAFVVGLIGMTIAEYLFVSTGVETFERQTLFGVMPLWLPVLWGYGFVTIKRITAILSTVT
ncbi:hypothetical protein KJ819_03725 [Patescibacteria group bacterium]|nr:hypothetical protein [Patescibacteria group bacterium]MBU1500470.1 hypothetical protein [Patescibacteria group bacterium]MBU2080732.1 hypothetical protein [Patescibacteria group bacterium]MBU2123837.1 hypothetical protein [Patescibacteria group bacterium]MBU2194872.1 hypothetical protein [Patescibacteria group bacterium]